MTDAEEKKDLRGTLRIDRTLYDELLDEQERLRKAEGKRPSHTDLVQRLLNAYHGRDRAKAHQHSGDPATTPTDPHERAVVAAALAFDREHDLPEEFREILFVLLKRWLPKGFKFNSGKKTA